MLAYARIVTPTTLIQYPGTRAYLVDRHIFATFRPCFNFKKQNQKDYFSLFQTQISYIL